MNSLDTNILIYAANRGAPEHAKALAVVRTMLAHPSEWILADAGSEDPSTRSSDRHWMASHRRGRTEVLTPPGVPGTVGAAAENPREVHTARGGDAGKGETKSLG